jgi:hypothetical protein
MSKSVSPKSKIRQHRLDIVQSNRIIEYLNQLHEAGYTIMDGGLNVSFSNVSSYEVVSYIDVPRKVETAVDAVK